MNLRTVFNFFALSCLLMRQATADPVSAPSVSPSPSPRPAFDIENLSISATELAEELGYGFFGAKWSFSTPTYVRIKMWSKTGTAADTPEHPEDSTVPGTVYELDGPLTEASIHLVQKETKAEYNEKSDATSVETTFHVKLSGKGVPETMDKDAVANGKPILSKLIYSQGTGFSSSFSLRRHGNQSFRNEYRHESGDFGAMLGTVVGAAAIGSDPATRQSSTTVDDSVRAGAEERMLGKPLNVYYYKAEVLAAEDKVNKVEHRAVFAIALECSRQPFKEPSKTADAPVPVDAR